MIDKGQVNTRERALSSDWNRQVELGNRGIVEGLSAAVSGNARESGVLGDTSYLVTPLNGTMKSAISPGLALYYDTTKVYPLSTMVWCESREVREVTHDAADVLARWDVVEMRPGELVSSTQPRDQFDPLTGTFSVVNMTKEIKSYPEFQVRKGNASASPAVPTGVAGWIPLAYVQIPANAVSVDQTKVVYCRPLLSDRNIDREGYTTATTANAYATNVKGGGLSFEGGNLVGSLVNSMSGRFAGHHHTFRITKASPVRITTMTWDGGGLPAVETVVYFYAIPAPYPAGYDSSMAKRELWTPNVDNLYGVSGGFYDVTLQSGCLIVASTKAPDPAHPAGASAGFGSFAHEFFTDGAPASSPASSWVYIGAGFFDDDGNQVVTQLCVGNRVATKRKPGKSFFDDLPIAAPTSYNMWSESVGDNVVQWPVTARDINLQVRATVNAAGNLRLNMFDEFGDDTNSAGQLINVFANNNAAQQFVGGIIQATTSATGDVTIKLASHSGAASANLFAKDYTDAVLALR